MIEPTSMQQHAIERLRDTYDTLGCAPYAPLGTRTWLVAAFERGIRKEWVELKRWRILPNGDVYDVLPGTPSADQMIAPPPDEAVAGDLPQLKDKRTIVQDCLHAGSSADALLNELHQHGWKIVAA